MEEEKQSDKVETDNRNIYQRMNDAMESVSYVQKTDKKVNNQYSFVKHDDVAAKVRPALLKNGITLVSSIVEKEIRSEYIKKPITYYDSELKTKLPVVKDNEVQYELTHMFVCVIFMKFEFVNKDKPDERIPADGYGMGMDSQDKAVGKASSYAKKYALLNAFLLATGDDPEKDVEMDNTYITESMAIEINKKADEVKADKQRFCNALGVPSIASIKLKDYGRALKLLEVKGERAA